MKIKLISISHLFKRKAILSHVFMHPIEICVKKFFFFSSPNIIGLCDKGRQRIAGATPYKSTTYR